MDILNIIICLIIATVSYILSYFQFKEKGILLNNAYLYASAEERKKMDKKPHYRQSGIVFSFIGTIFVLSAVLILTKWNLIFYSVIAATVVMIIYAIFSSIQIEMKK